MTNVRSIIPNEPADFTQEVGNYKTLQPFRYWCHKVLPLVYDDSLSYYELLCKVVDYLNKTMEDVETLHDDVTNLHKAYEELQSYVNDYFSSLDVQEEINNKLDNMASSGVLYEIIKRYTDPIINEQNNKIDDAISEQNNKIDDAISEQNNNIDVLKGRMDTFSSLPSGSTSGNAELLDIRVKSDGTTATSAGNAVREQVSELNNDLDELKSPRGINIWDEEWELGNINALDGSVLPSTERIRSKNFIHCDSSSSYFFYTNGYPVFVFYYNENYEKVGTAFGLNNLGLKNEIITTPSNAKYIKFRIDESYGTIYKHDVSINSDMSEKYNHYYTANDIIARSAIENAKETLTPLGSFGKYTVIENNSTTSLLKFTGKQIGTENGNIIITNTKDTYVINSDFIPIEELIHIETNGNDSIGFVAIAFFSEKNYNSFLGALYGDEVTLNEWKTLRADIKDLTIPANAKYAVLQANATSAIIQKSGQLVCKIVKTKYETTNRFNVLCYGAKGDGVTDDTDAIQSAIDDCFTKSGGVVYFPNGKYALNKVYTRGVTTAHLFIPVGTSLENRVTIRLEGESSIMYPSFYIEFNGYIADTPKFNGATIYSKYVPTESELTTPISVLGSQNVSNFISCNFTRLQIEHLNIATHIDTSENYPKVSGIDASRIASVSIKDVTVGTDLKCTSLVAPPGNHVSFGIAMPKRLCDPNQLIEEVCIAGGYKYGIICTEHVHGINVQLQNCIHAFVMAATDHPNYFGLCSVHGSKYQLSALDKPFGAYDVGSAGVRFALLDFEENVNQTPTYFNYSAGVYDPNNHLKGHLNYFMVKSKVGMTNVDWTVVGANKLTITSEN